MGWWSSTILGGDGPLDTLGRFAKLCGVGLDVSGARDETLNGYPFDRDAVERSLAAMVASVRAEKFCESRSVAGQVLGGADVPADVLALCTE